MLLKRLPATDSAFLAGATSAVLKKPFAIFKGVVIFDTSDPGTRRLVGIADKHLDFGAWSAEEQSIPAHAKP